MKNHFAVDAKVDKTSSTIHISDMRLLPSVGHFTGHNAIIHYTWYHHQIWSHKLAFPVFRIPSQKNQNKKLVHTIEFVNYIVVLDTIGYPCYDIQTFSHLSVFKPHYTIAPSHANHILLYRTVWLEPQVYCCISSCRWFVETWPHC